MVWEGVPWMVKNADHSAEVGRVVANAATGDGEGVNAPTHCKVTASAIPDGNVHIEPGGVTMRNRYPGGSAQSYIGRNEGDEPVAIRPQGSSGTRHDLVCVVVQDPQYPGQPDPADILDGPYTVSKVYEDVPEQTRFLWEVDPNQVGYALARVRMNPSDGTVSPEDITDLRELATPRTQTERLIVNGAAAKSLAVGDYTQMPDGSSKTIRIPSWATKVQMYAIWSGLVFTDTNNAAGQARGYALVNLGSITPTGTQWLEDATGANKPTTPMLMSGGEAAVPAALRGTVQPLRAQLRATLLSGMTVQATPNTTVLIEATFSEQVA